MNRQTRSARRYAQALFDIAVDRNAIDSWSTELSRLSDLTTDPLAARVLATPGGNLPSQRRAIDTIAGPLSPEVGRVVDLLLERKRGLLLAPLAEAFAELVREHRGILRADVTTAVPLSDRERQLVGTRLQQHFGKTMELHLEVDPALLGGVVARVGDQVLDGSLRGGLRRLRQQLAAPRV